MAVLLDLPSEVHLVISSWLPDVSLACLSYTCKHFRTLLDFPPTPRRRAIRKFNLEREGKDPDRERLTCSQCLRLRRFFHFDKKQANLKTASDVRRCLDCLSTPKRLLGKMITWISTTKMTVCPHCRQMVICEGYADLVILPHVGAPGCARHYHRVRMGAWCPGGSRRAPCSDRCETCHRHCSTPNCSQAVYSGERLCGKGHENEPHAWDAPEPSPPGAEIVVSRLRAMLDQAQPPPLRRDFFRSPGRGRLNNSMGELIESLLTCRLERGKEPEDGPGGDCRAQGK